MAKTVEYSWRDEILTLALQRKKSLEDLIENKTKQIQKAPEGTLRAVRKSGYSQYYWRTDPKDTNGLYLTKKRRNIAQQLAQKEYDIKILSSAKKELAALDDYIMTKHSSDVLDVYAKINPAKKGLVVPIMSEDNDFVKAWRAEDYRPFVIDDALPEFCSDSGIRVRSKSELMIANMLEKSGVPYRYEYPLKLRGLGDVRPDFLCLNIRTRKEFIWEHFGMMDNIAYANKNVVKIRAYESNGYYAGVNMIMTFETSQNAIGSSSISALISEYLC